MDDVANQSSVGGDIVSNVHGSKEDVYESEGLGGWAQ